MKKIVGLLGWVFALASHAQPTLADASPDAVPRAQGISAARPVDSLEQVQLQLQLNAEQLPLWRAYQSKVEAYTQHFYRERPVVPSAQESAPAQMGRLVMNLQNRLTLLEDAELAAKHLYAALTPPQQLLANQALLGTLPSFLPMAGPDSAFGDGRRPESRSGNEMRRRGGGMSGGMGAGRGF